MFAAKLTTRNRFAARLIAAFAVGLVSAPIVGQVLPLEKESGEAVTDQVARPRWSELSARQKKVLAPIASEWHNLDSARRKKWVTIANRYNKYSADAQVKLQMRMRAWVSLSPVERNVARKNFHAYRTLPHGRRRTISEAWTRDQTPQSAADQKIGPETQQ